MIEIPQFCVKDEPIPVTSRIITPLIGLISSFTHLFLAIYRGPEITQNGYHGTPILTDVGHKRKDAWLELDRFMVTFSNPFSVQWD